LQIVREAGQHNNLTGKEVGMSTIVKVLEVIAESNKSFDDAAQQAVREAAKSVRGIKSIWIDNFSGVVEGDRIVEFRVNAKLSFLVEGH
jgi:flavin-binding protein dodecin